jgi:hypothetical protein
LIFKGKRDVVTYRGKEQIKMGEKEKRERKREGKKK